jgi:hypothetical protein
MPKHHLVQRLAGLVVAAAVTTAVTVTATLATPSPAQAGPDWIRINAFHSNLVATIPAPWTTNNLVAEQQPYSVNARNGHWQKVAVPSAPEMVQFVNRKSAQCLGLGVAVFTPGEVIDQNPCNASDPTQWWYLEQDPLQAAYRIYNGASWMAMTVENGSVLAGARFVQRPFVGGASQLMQNW